MNYTQFSSKPNVITKILLRLGIIEAIQRVVKIRTTPDYDITDFNGSSFANYYFHNEFEFADFFNSVVSAQLGSRGIFDFETIERLSVEMNLECTPDLRDCVCLNEALKRDKNSFDDYNFGETNGDFKLNELRVKAIDNLGRTIHYEGSFLGNSADINPDHWSIYSILDALVIPKTIENQPFYKSLLAEGYLLLIERNYKLSYFLIYSALESFINYQLQHNDDAVRLKEKLNELFTSKFANLHRHQIYTSVIKSYDEYTTERNIIAHGRENLEISKEKLIQALLFVATLISTYEFDSLTFDDLIQKIES